MRFVFAALLVVAATACADGGGTGPEILQLAPTVATPGDTLEVIGERFCADQGVDADGGCVVPPAGSIHIGAGTTVVRAETLRWTDERIRVDVSDDAATGATVVTVSVEGVVSNAVDFEVAP